MNKLLYAVLASMLAAPAAASPTYVLFDPSPGTDASAAAVNADGVVAGKFGSNPTIGFIGHPDGSLETFAADPGATSTSPTAINDSGQVAGTTIDSAGNWHGFLRQPDGSEIPIDYPRAAMTEATAINNQGVVAGVYHGKHQGCWLRDPNGRFHGFVVAKKQRTCRVYGINDAGEVAGDITVGRGFRGFLRTAKGSIKVFDAPDGRGTTIPKAIAADGSVAGYYADANAAGHGFVRHPDGTLEEFDAPGSVETVAYGINAKGIVVGSTVDQHGVTHAFSRKPDGTFGIFDVPQVGNAAAQAIARSGMIVGSFLDSETTQRSKAFLRLP
jgi:uncharacterized membrane protein